MSVDLPRFLSLLSRLRRLPRRALLVAASIALSAGAAGAVLLGAVAFGGFLGFEMRRCADSAIRSGSTMSASTAVGPGVGLRVCSAR